MVPIQGGRAAPPVEAAISVDSVAAVGSTAGVSTPVWAVAVCALALSAVGASTPIWAAATCAPMGMRGCPLCRLLSRCFPRQPELFVGVVDDRSRVASSTAAQNLELCCRRTCSIRRLRCFYFRSRCCQFRRRQPCCPRCCRCSRCCFSKRLHCCCCALHCLLHCTAAAIAQSKRLHCCCCALHSCSACCCHTTAKDCCF
jgi:hypothetical protein